MNDSVKQTDLIDRLREAKRLSQKMLYSSFEIMFQLSLGTDSDDLKSSLYNVQQDYFCWNSVMDTEKNHGGTIPIFDSEVINAIEATEANGFKSEAYWTCVKAFGPIRHAIVMQLDAEKRKVLRIDQLDDLCYLWGQLGPSPDYAKMRQEIKDLYNLVTPEMRDRVTFEFNSTISRLQSARVESEKATDTKTDKKKAKQERPKCNEAMAAELISNPDAGRWPLSEWRRNLPYVYGETTIQGTEVWLKCKGQRDQRDAERDLAKSDRKRR